MSSVPYLWYLGSAKKPISFKALIFIRTQWPGMDDGIFVKTLIPPPLFSSKIFKFLDILSLKNRDISLYL